MANKLTYAELEQRIKDLEKDSVRCKQIEKSQQESEMNLKRAQRITKMGSWSYDTTFKIASCSDGIFDIFGIDKTKYPDGRISESVWLSILQNPTETNALSKSLSKSLAKRNNHYEYEYLTIPINGKIKTMYSRCEVERDENGKIVRIFGTDHDITERKQLEKALIESERNLRRAQHISKIGSWYYDRATGNEIWSDECFKLFGLKKDNYPENVVPAALSFSFYADPEKTAKLGSYLAEKYDTYDLEFNTIPINGQVKTIHSYCEVERDNDGNLLKVFGSDHDVTEQKMMEYQLIKAKEQADAANKAKSEFLGNISHELRTPMQGINGFSNLAIKRFKTTKKAKLLEYFSSIYSSGRRLLALLNDLLDLSKLEAGMVVYNLEKSKMSELVFNAINGLESLAKEKNIRIEFQPPKFADVVTLDKEIITQLIVNLLSNAIKFSEPGSEIRVESDIRDESFSLSVIDKGIGVPNNELESIFDKFIQSSKTKTGAGGTGLGLAICKEIIEAHNGKIWAENNPEGGATFSFMLPYEQNSQ
jgi:signal transduction histidine kinase